MRPLTIIHPLYFEELAKCPRCDGSEVSWSGWTTTGHCEVHGLDREETALGYQLRCKSCNPEINPETNEPAKTGDGTYCFTTTNYMFWERREHWQIPRKYSHISRVDRNLLTGDPCTYSTAGIPYFTKCCALSQDLFNLIVEFRLTMTSAGLAEHIRREWSSRARDQGTHYETATQSYTSAAITRNDWRT